MKTEEIEQLIRAGLAKHNLKLYPEFYFHPPTRECCAVGALILGEMDKLPKDDYIKLGRAYQIVGQEHNVFELEAGFMSWRKESDGSDPELFALGQKLRSECVLREEVPELDEEDNDYPESDWNM